jgi:hypothetical protein
MRIVPALLACLLCGCGAARPRTHIAGVSRSLVEQARQIGPGSRFRPPVTGVVGEHCASALGARTAAHVELFVADRVVIVAAGIGVMAPWRLSAARIVHARCYGELVTLEPTGVVLVRPTARASLGTLFRAWGQPLSRTRLASFSARHGARVRVFVDGRRWHGEPGSVPLSAHAEIVLEVGPYVPPHSSFAFPPDP